MIRVGFAWGVKAGTQKLGFSAECIGTGFLPPSASPPEAVAPTAAATAATRVAPAPTVVEPAVEDDDAPSEETAPNGNKNKDMGQNC